MFEEHERRDGGASGGGEGDTIPKPDGLAAARATANPNGDRTRAGRRPGLSDECSRLAVDFAAVPDGGDVEGMAVVMEAEPVVSDAEAELGWLDALESFYVSLAGGGEGGESVKNAQGGWLVDGAELGLGLVAPVDLLGVHAHCPGRRGSGSSGVCPMRSKSAAVRPNSARTSSWDTTSPRA
jgi:hypothetical protein